ncbi:Uncharacterised protein [Vibrio cholerae]|nr:Uncharacterised protein [Vibrio cholerae]
MDGNRTHWIINFQLIETNNAKHHQRARYCANRYRIKR